MLVAVLLPRLVFVGDPVDQIVVGEGTHGIVIRVIIAHKELECIAFEAGYSAYQQRRKTGINELLLLHLYIIFLELAFLTLFFEKRVMGLNTMPAP